MVSELYWLLVSIIFLFLSVSGFHWFLEQKRNYRNRKNVFFADLWRRPRKYYIFNEVILKELYGLFEQIKFWKHFFFYKNGEKSKRTVKVKHMTRHHPLAMKHQTIAGTVVDIAPERNWIIVQVNFQNLIWFKINKNGFLKHYWRFLSSFFRK